MGQDDLALHNPATVTERVNDTTTGNPPQIEELPNALQGRAVLQALFANAKASGDLDAETTAYLSRATELVAQASARDLAPLTTRLRAVMEADETHFANEFAALYADRTVIAKKIFKQTAAARAFEAALGAALVNGLTAPPTE